MTKAILTCMHKYTPYGGEYYAPIYNYFIANLEKVKDEFDKLYLIDSNWGIKNPPKFAEVIGVNPSLRYYDAYKEVLPAVKEDLVLFLDNDFVIYKKGIVKDAFDKLKEYDVVSIFDTIGKTFKELGGKSKFCPYFFATRKDLLMEYLDVDWGPNMPEHETLGKLTEKMLKDGVRPCEMEEDKSSIYLISNEHGAIIEYDNINQKSKDLGYYHIRAGSTPAVLLAWRKYAPETYKDYIKNQPKREYLRQIMWFAWMYENTNPKPSFSSELIAMIKEMGVNISDWTDYREKFIKYHGL